MTLFVSTQYPHLRMAGLGVQFEDGHAEVADPDVAARLAQCPTPGVGLADGEELPAVEPRRPAKAASRADWEAYVLATVDVDESEAADMTKAQLQELADATDDE